MLWSLLRPAGLHSRGACPHDHCGCGRRERQGGCRRNSCSSSQIVLLIAVGRGLGEIMQRLGQPSVIGELLAGLILGPSLFGWLWPEAQHAIFPKTPEQKAMIDGIAQFGILLLLLLTGMETDLKLVRKVGKAAIAISIAGIVVPFACGFALGEFLPDSLLPNPEQRLVASLFMGTALSISSVKIVAVVVREMNFMRRDVGQIIVATAVIDDTIGWIIIAVIFSPGLAGLARHRLGRQSRAGHAGLPRRVASPSAARLVFHLIRWANDNLVSTAAVITVILLLMSAMALITHLIGVHTVPRRLRRRHSGRGIADPDPADRRAPARADLDLLHAGVLRPCRPERRPLGAARSQSPDAHRRAGRDRQRRQVRRRLCRRQARRSRLSRNRFALASGMNARGSTEVIIATIGLSIGVLSQNLFTMIVTMAIVTTMAMPPMLRAALAKLPMNKDEKERLEREEFEKRGFVANLERPLLAVDERVNATFAAHIAGLIVGTGACRSPCCISAATRKSRRRRAARRRATRRW